MKDWIQKQLISLISPSLVSTLVRGLMKYVGGVLVGLGASGQAVDQFVDASTQILIGVIMYFISEGLSIAQKKIAPAVPVIVKDKDKDITRG